MADFTLTPINPVPEQEPSGFTLTPLSVAPAVQPEQVDKPEFTLKPLKSDTTETRPSNPQELPESLSPKAKKEVKIAEAQGQLKGILEEYGRPLNKQDFLEDKRLMDLVRLNMEARYRTGNYGVGGTGYSYLTSASGGATGRRWQEKSDEELFEMWQNYHRSFAGGQTVTTANEVGYLTQADEDTKAVMGMGYTLFDSMGNIFGKDTSWGEMFDGVGDYISAAVWDPTTIFSLGVGKALSAGGTKVAAEGVRRAAIAAAKEAIKNGATRQAAEIAGKKAAQEAIKQASRFTAKEAVKTTAKYSAVDFAANVGADIAYQNVLIDTGAQEEYSKLQTGFAALGTLAIPGIAAATKIGSTGARALGARGYTGVSAGTSFMRDEEILNTFLKETISTQVPAKFRETSDSFAKMAPQTPDWRQAADAAKKAVSSTELGEVNQKFWQTFLFGDDDLGFDGLVQTMVKNGVEWVPRNSDDTISRFLGDVISWLGDDTVNTIVKNYETVIGKELLLSEVDILRRGGTGGMDVAVQGANKYTADGLADVFRARASWLGQGLAQSSIAKQYLAPDAGNAGQRIFSQAVDGADPTVGQFVEGLVNNVRTKPVEQDPKRLSYVQSVWKRLLTAHPATTGLNVKGWAMMYGSNTISDLVQGTMQIALSPIPVLRGADSTAKAYQMGKGSILGALRRGSNILDPNDTLRGAEEYLALKPEIAEELFAVISGDAGIDDVVKRFELNPDSKLVAGTEKTVRTVQGLVGVALQDELTKHISFMSALDTAVRREYGETFTDFIENRSASEAFQEMMSTRWKTRVDAWALDRAVRETASKTWTAKNRGANLMREGASLIETLSNNAALGYAVPFGRFFNTATATLGDYTGMNFVRFIGKKAFKRDINFAEEEGLALAARAAVGLTGFYLASEPSMEKLKEGLAWNQERRPDGSIQDNTYDWPESIFRIMGQVLAHARQDGWGEVPKELAAEGMAVLGAQTFRTLDDAGKSIYQLGEAILSLNPEEAGALLLEQSLGMMANVVSGATRPLDPINQAAMIYQGDTATPDRRQGVKFINEATRYIDHLFGDLSSNLPDRAYPTRNEPVGVDIGRSFGGTRSTPEPLPVERMLASIGRPNWTAVKWQGPAEVKNRLDELIGPILNTEAAIALEKNKDFFDMSLNQRQKITNDVITTARKTTNRIFESSTKTEDKGLELVRDLSKVDKKDLARAQDYLGFDGDPIDMLAEENGLQNLELLLYFGKNWDKVEPRFWETD